MKRVLLDFGNTRMKYVVADGSDMSELGAVTYDGGVTACVSAIAALGITNCTGASVRGEEFDRQFAGKLKQASGVDCHFVSVSNNRELDLAYRDPSRFGVDRYLNLLGALSLGYHDALVVSAGTAVTFDGLQGTRHLGGCIFPGVGLLGEALFDRTSMIRALPLDEMASCFAGSTEKAVTAGVRQGYVGGVTHIIKTMKCEMPKHTAILMTGGDAGMLAKSIELSIDVESNLLFRGLLRLTS